MIKMKMNDFKDMYEKHIHFLAQDCENWEDMCADFEGCDFSGYELSGMNFSKAKFRNCDFSNADLRACHFDGCDMSGVRFRNTKMQLCSFEDAVFVHASFIDTKAYKTCFDMSKVDYCHFRNCDLRKTSWFEARLRNNYFEESNLARIQFIRTSFRRKNTFAEDILVDCTIDEIEGFENLIIDSCLIDEDDEPQSGLASLKYICKKEYGTFRLNKLKGSVVEQLNTIGKRAIKALPEKKDKDGGEIDV